MISFGFHGEWRGVQSSPKEYKGGLWKSDCQCVEGGGAGGGRRITKKLNNIRGIREILL